MINLSIFASGNGSNVENIYNYFKSKKNINISLVFCNKEKAGVLDRAKRLGIKSHVFNKAEFMSGEKISELLDETQTNFIILAGFLWLIPEYLLKKFPNKIINIHPALLPKFGGKGMYGMNVHKAVIEKGEKETGITIHFINEEYDKGDIIFQAKCEVYEQDTPELVAGKVHQLEYEHFPRIIEKVVLGHNSE